MNASVTCFVSHSGVILFLLPVRIVFALYPPNLNTPAKVVSVSSIESVKISVPVMFVDSSSAEKRTVTSIFLSLSASSVFRKSMNSSFFPKNLPA